jgi:WD40 repeat protein
MEDAMKAADRPSGSTCVSPSFSIIVALTCLVARGEERVKPRLQLRGHDSFVEAVTFSPDSKTLASGSVDIILWDSQTGARKRMLRFGEWGGVSRIAFLPDGGGLISANGEGLVKLWELSGKDESRTLISQRGTMDFALSPDGCTLAMRFGELAIGQHYGDLHLWDIETGKSKRVLERESAGRGWTYSPDGKTLAAGYRDSRVKFWDVQSGAVRFTFQPYDDNCAITNIRFAPDGRTVAIWGGPQRDKMPFPDIILWDSETQQRIASFPCDDVFGCEFDFSPDEQILAVSSKTNVKLWNVATREIRATLVGDGWRHIACLAFSPDGKFLAAGTTYTIRPLRDAKVLVWDVPSGTTDIPEKN